MLPTAVTSLVAVYVCVCALYVVFIHPSTPHALSLSVGLSRSVRIIEQLLFGCCCWLARLGAAEAA